MKKLPRFVKINDRRIKISTINEYIPVDDHCPGIKIKFTGSKEKVTIKVDDRESRDKIVALLDSLLLDDSQI